MIHCRQGTKPQLLRSNSVQSICCLLSPDTTSLHLSVAFYYLCTHIYLLLRRRDEVRSASGLSVVSFLRIGIESFALHLFLSLPTCFLVFVVKFHLVSVS